MRCEIKMRGAKGLGNPGATWGVIISQLMYSATTEAMILNEEATSKVSYAQRALGEVRTRSYSPTNGLEVGPESLFHLRFLG
jgi:hypothetical protein